MWKIRKRREGTVAPFPFTNLWQDLYVDSVEVNSKTLTCWLIELKSFIWLVFCDKFIGRDVKIPKERGWERKGARGRGKKGDSVINLKTSLKIISNFETKISLKYCFSPLQQHLSITSSYRLHFDVLLEEEIGKVALILCSLSALQTDGSTYRQYQVLKGSKKY